MMLFGTALDNLIVLNNGTTDSAGAGVRTAAYRLANDRIVYHGNNGVYTAQYEWCKPAGTAGDYEVLATMLLGSLSSGTVGSWLNLGTTRTWSVADPVVDALPVTARVQFDIRRVSTSQILDTAIVDFDADRAS